MNTLNATNLNPHPLVDLESIALSVDALGQVNVRDDHGNVFENVSPVRLFPLTRPHHWIALLDASGRELICIDDPKKLGEKNRQILESELTRREFVPILQRVVWVSGNSEPCEWRVETDRGPTSFILKDEGDVRRLGDHGVIVVDSFGIRFFIPDRNTLDAYSRRIIEWYV
ncbi:MAG: DUF1854 domain-containing protein [Pirellulaceae bacterium]